MTALVPTNAGKDGPSSLLGRCTSPSSYRARQARACIPSCETMSLITNLHWRGSGCLGDSALPAATIRNIPGSSRSGWPSCYSFVVVLFWGFFPPTDTVCGGSSNNSLRRDKNSVAFAQSNNVMNSALETQAGPSQGNHEHFYVSGYNWPWV
jgi:hypothetical protein